MDFNLYRLWLENQKLKAQLEYFRFKNTPNTEMFEPKYYIFIDTKSE